METWLTADKLMKLLSVLRDSFLCKCDAECSARQTYFFLLIELLASSFQLTNEAQQIHRVS